MLYTYLRNRLSCGFVFGDEKSLTTYLNRVIGYMKGRKLVQRTSQAHKFRVLQMFRSGELHKLSASARN